MIFVIARSRLHYTNPRTILVRPVDLKAGALSQSTTCWFRQAYVCVATAVFFLLTLSIATAREVTTFEQYRWQIIGTAALCGIQSILIIVLLVHRERLRRANVERLQTEQAMHVLNGRLINAQEEERSRLARELHDDVSQRLALLAINAGREERALPKGGGGEAMRAMREDLVRLSEDVHTLSHQLHPSIP
jgi:signal transduction histidine kinase